VQRYLTRLEALHITTVAYRKYSIALYNQQLAYYQTIMPVTGNFAGHTTQVIEADGVTVEPPYNGSTGVDYLTAHSLLNKV